MAQIVRMPKRTPKLVIEVRFTKRELEFIELRYGQQKPYKEIAPLMHISLRTSKAMGEMVGKKLGLYGPDPIRATKILIKHGFISTD